MRRNIFLFTCFLLTTFSVSAPAKQVRPVYPVELLLTSGGRITPNIATVRQGQKHVRFSIKPEKGFAIADVTLNGVSRGIASAVTVPVVNGPLRVEATFVPGIATVDAGEDAGGYAGVPLTLHGSAVPAVAGDPVKYEWKVVKKEGRGHASLTGSHTASPTFVASKPGVYEARLRVTEQGNEATDSVTIYVDASPKAFPPQAKIMAEPVVVTGEEIVLNGDQSYDPLRLPLSYLWQFKSRPKGSAAEMVNPSGTLGRFVADVPGEYVISLTAANDYAAGTATVRITAKSIAAPDLLTLRWKYGVPGHWIGREGLHIVDLDGDNKPEIVASAGSFWCILQRQQNGSYEQVWRSEDFHMVRVLVADIDQDKTPEIIVAQADGVVRIYHGTVAAEIRKYPTINLLKDVTVADLDGDGTVEIAATDGTAVSVFAAANGNLKWSLPGAGGDVLRIGNVDDDPEPEIIITTGGGKGYVIDTASRSIQWDYADGFGSHIVLADIDSDGRSEIIGRTSAFDADLQKPSLHFQDSIDLMAFSDLDGDGISDMIGVAANEILWIDLLTFGRKWSLGESEGIQSLTIGDIDGDGKSEVVWGTTNSLVIGSPASGVQWRLTPVDGPLNAVDSADVDDDGQDEIVMVSLGSEYYYEEGVLHVFDARTHAVEYKERIGRDSSQRAHALYAGDVDGDGKSEIVITSADSDTSVIRIFDGPSRTLRLKKEISSTQAYLLMAVGDLENDGKREIVIPLMKDDGWHLVVLDGETLEEKWTSARLWTSSFDNYISDIKVVDLDGDGFPEILASTPGGGVYVCNTKTEVVKEVYMPAVSITFIGGAEGDTDIVVARGDGKVSIVDGKTLELKKTVSTASTARIDAIHATDINGDGNDEWIIVQDQRVWVLGKQGQEVDWMSEKLPFSPWFTRLLVRDTDRDGRKEIIVGGDDCLYHFAGIE